jgi:hypothetical protein
MDDGGSEFKSFLLRCAHNAMQISMLQQREKCSTGHSWDGPGSPAAPLLDMGLRLCERRISVAAAGSYKNYRASPPAPNPCADSCSSHAWRTAGCSRSEIGDCGVLRETAAEARAARPPMRHRSQEPQGNQQNACPIDSRWPLWDVLQGRRAPDPRVPEPSATRSTALTPHPRRAHAMPFTSNRSLTDWDCARVGLLMSGIRLYRSPNSFSRLSARGHISSNIGACSSTTSRSTRTSVAPSRSRKV